MGNTLVKVALFEGDTLQEVFQYENFGEAEYNIIKKLYPAIRYGILSSVRNENHDLHLFLNNHLDNYIYLDSQTPVPIENLYQTKETLGKDRLAAIVGANFLYPDKDLLVIDAGSAITFDFINAQGQYFGGNIAPGLSMRFRALHEYTSKLPLQSQEEGIPLLGRNTKEAIIAGVQNSIVFETDAYIETIKGIHPGLISLLTGGDAKFFDNKLKNSIFVVSNLVHIGLNRILNFRI
jgi:type III pantothenate kinase